MVCYYTYYSTKKPFSGVSVFFNNKYDIKHRPKSLPLVGAGRR